MSKSSFSLLVCALAVLFFSKTTAQNLQLLGHLAYPGASLAGCWHHVDDLGNEYGLIGTSLGLSIVDLNDPANPREIFKIESLPNNWREVKTWGGFAYFGSEAQGSGITIVDLRQLPDTVFTKVWTGDGQFFGDIQTSHAVGAEDGYLYIYGGSTLTDGVIICDLADPWNPKIVGQYDQNYVHDGFVRGNRLWTSEIYEGQFSVIDITDRSNPVVLQTQETPGKFNHNGWLSLDGNTFFTTDERANTPLASFDVSDLNNIRQLDTYFPSQKPSSEVHNTRGIGHFLINPSYGGQLTIVDATHPDNLVEIAFASLGTSLVWDADPYLPSGIVFATAKLEGLFIFKPTYQPAAYLEGTVTDASTGQPIPGATVTLVGNPLAETTRLDGVFKTGAAEAGTYNLLISKPGYAAMTVVGVVLENGKITVADVALSPTVNAKGIENQSRRAKVLPTVFNKCLTVETPVNSIFSGSDTQISITDLAGKPVAQAPSAGHRTEICLQENLPTGQYLVFLQNEKGRSAPVRVVKG